MAAVRPDPRRAAPAAAPPTRMNQTRGGAAPPPSAKSSDPRMQSDVQRQLKAIYEHRPFFTYFVSFVQVDVAGCL
jgi:hypothetical protein